ncbi:MAG: hypothetical protein IJU13_09625 [Bacteroidales bacterium]|nr:hypothetical protein [Bacteroidales bacterium]
MWQSAKTIYDPCPPGWKVPEGGEAGVWYKAAKTHNYFTRKFDSTNKGMDSSEKFGSASTIWYPAAGVIDGRDGLHWVGVYAIWYSCTPKDYYVGVFSFSNTTGVYPSKFGYRADVRSGRDCSFG